MTEEDKMILQEMIENGADEDEIVTFKALAQEDYSNFKDSGFSDLVNRDIEAMKNGKLPREFFWSPYGPERINKSDINEIIRLAGRIALYKSDDEEAHCSFPSFIWNDSEERKTCEKIICSDAYMNFLREAIKRIKERKASKLESSEPSFSMSDDDEEIPF